MFWEGTALEAIDDADSRRFLPHALLATALVIVVPAVVVIGLSPLTGVPDVLVSALLATGLSIVAGSAGSLAWSQLPGSRQIPFGDLMLWSWARRARSERRLAKVGKAVAAGEPLDAERELAALRRLSVVFEARDGFTHGHSGRVARHAERIARRMGLPADEVERIEAAAAVHDIGMVRIPRSILAKRGDLSVDERVVVERHPVHGAEQVAAVADPRIAELVRHHHERVDGGGYPDGLAGAEIPLGARIIAVADAFDELTAAGPQREPQSRRSALDTLSERAGSELDPAVVAAFAAYYSGARSIAGVAFAATAPQRLARWIAAAPAGIGSAAGTPALVQGVCAAGTLAIAGACIGGLPAIAPDRDGGSPAQRAERATGTAAGGSTATLADAGAETGRRADDGRVKGRRDGRERSVERGGVDAPVDAAPRGDGGTGSQPTPPTTGGGSQPVAGGGGGGGSGGSGSAGGAPPASSPPATPSAQPPQAVGGAVDGVVGGTVAPVLDGVGQAVPPVKPVTDAVNDLLGGLTGQR